MSNSVRGWRGDIEGRSFGRRPEGRVSGKVPMRRPLRLPGNTKPSIKKVTWIVIGLIFDSWEALLLLCRREFAYFWSIHPWTLNVRPLAVLRSFSSFSGLALLSTARGQHCWKSQRMIRVLALQEIRCPSSHPRVDVSLQRVILAWAST